MNQKSLTAQVEAARDAHNLAQDAERQAYALWQALAVKAARKSKRLAKPTKRLRQS